MFKVILAVMVLVCAGAAHGQITNGEFESGPAGWDWRDAVHFDPFAYCEDVMEPFVASYQQTPMYAIGTDRAARVDAGPSYAVGTWYSCREISQTVVVPVGQALKLDRRLGTTSYNISSSTVTLKVYVEDLISGVEKKVLERTASNCYQCATPIVTEEMDVSAFWGREVRVRILASTSGQNTSIGFLTTGAPAWVDSVQFVALARKSGTPKAGGFYNPQRSGQGIHLSKAPDGKFSAIWYSYLADGTPVWYMSDIAGFVGGVWQSPLYKFTWNTSTGSRNPGVVVGDVRIEKLSYTGDRISFLWDFHHDGNSAGYDGGEILNFLSGGEGYTGMWFEPALPGWGLSVDNEDGVTAVTVFYYEGTKPSWAYAVVESDPESNVTMPVVRYTSTGLCPECRFEPVTRAGTVVGNLGLGLEIPNGWIGLSGPGFVWNRGTSGAPVGMGRLTYP